MADHAAYHSNPDRFGDGWIGGVSRRAGRTIGDERGVVLRGVRIFRVRYRCGNQAGSIGVANRRRARVAIGETDDLIAFESY